MRTTITQDPTHPNRCTLRYEDEMGEVVERDFFAPATGGYVREDWSNPRQVCRELASRGVTLMWDPKDGPLSTLIRAERRRALAADRRRWARA